MKNLSNENVIHVIKNDIQYLQFRKLLEYDNIITILMNTEESNSRPYEYYYRKVK